jgi:predicted dehydrogenase
VTSAFRWGFLGAGFIARTALAPAVHAASGSVLQACAARDRNRALDLQPVGRAYDDYDALVEDPDVDGVYVALANDAHLPAILGALAAGKHVLCEKPMCLTETETATAVSAAQAAGRLLVEASWYRWHPRTRRAEQLIADGALGEVTNVETALCFSGVAARNYRLDPARGGGALYDVGCYAVSAAHWALGDLAVVSADASYAETGVDLQTQAVLRGATGQAQVACSIDAPQRDVLRVQGTVGALTFADAPFMSYRAPAMLAVIDADGSARTEAFAPVDAYQLMVEAFAQRAGGRCDGNDAYVLPLAQSLRTARTLDAVRARAGSLGSPA